MKFQLILTGLVLDLSSCAYNTIETVPDCTNGIVIDIVNTQNSSCGLDIGTLQVEVQSGSQIEGDVRFSIDGISFQNSGKFNNLSAGTYNVIAKDANCQAEIQVVISNEEGLNAIAESTTSACGEASGTISINTENEVGEVTYVLNGGEPQSNAIFNDLAPGNYQIKVSDDSGCDIELEANITSNVDYEMVETIVKNSCAISGCHAGNVAPDFRNKDNIISRSGRILARTSYYYRLTERDIEGYYDSVAFGIDLETGGHVFQLQFTNSRAMIEKGFIRETTGSYFEGDIHFGFNITRTF